jgi:hypothetical protein
MALGPPFGPCAASAPTVVATSEVEAISLRAVAAASSLRTELWTQNDANGGIRVILGSRLRSPGTPTHPWDCLRTIEGAA